MNGSASKLARCAIYTRKSSDHNLDLTFTSLHAQREACEAYVKSQAHEGWRLIPGRYDDGAFSGASLDRPALQKLLADVREGTIDIVLVYKVDRLTRSLADFAKLIELFDAHDVSFVSVTQSFNTKSSMGRLTLNVLLSFAQFEREVIGERVPSEWGRWHICSRTGSTSARWSTAARSIGATTSRSSIVICSRPCRRSLRPKPWSGAAGCGRPPPS
jgi:site-specific DNA recombinase